MFRQLLENQKSKFILGVLALIACSALMFFDDVQIRLHWMNIPSTLLIAFIAFVVFQKYNRDTMFGEFSRNLFRKDVWFHRSAVNDYIFICINVILFTTLIEELRLPVIIFVHYVDVLLSILPFEPNSEKPGLGVIILYTICHVVVLDFFLFLAHYLMHKIPLLWELHKVHHSAETLTPFTAFRIHPLETVFAGIMGVTGAGITLGVFFHFYPNIEGFLTIMGVSVGTILFNFFGANLRHSHVWLSYGPFFEKIFISPSQHHLHHSSNPIHFDKNMGFIFALWDRLFGTLYVTNGVEEFKYGIGVPEEDVKFRSVWGMFVEPLKGIARIVIGEKRKQDSEQGGQGKVAGREKFRRTPKR